MSDKIDRGKNAAWLLEQAAFRDALDSCLLHCQLKWANSASEDSAARETLYHQFTAVHSIEEMLKNIMEDGLRQEREDHGDK